MALTRAMLKGMGLTDEQLSAIIDEHVSVTGALKDEIKELKQNADKLPAVQKELDDLKKDIADNDWKTKYDREHDDFEKFKNSVAEEKRIDRIKAAYRALLSECKVGEKHIASIMKVTDFSTVSISDDGKLEGIEELKNNINNEWSGFIQTSGVKGSDVPNPPGKDGKDEQPKTRASQLAAKYHENLYGKQKEV